jgi:hypothetical protein
MRVKIRVISLILLSVSCLLFVGPKESITSPIRKINDGSPSPVKHAANHPRYRKILSSLVDS